MKQKLKKHEPIDDEELDKKLGIRRVKLNILFARFLNQLEAILKKQYCKEMCVLMAYFRLTINKIGWRELKPDGDYEEEFCEQNGAFEIARLSNLFIVKYLP